LGRTCMAEHDMRGKVVKMLRPLHGIAVENPCLPGTADVNYVEGWIELKWLRAWPKRPETVVHIEHYTQEQRLWSVARRLAGGTSWLLLQCKREWLLFDSGVAAKHLNAVPRSDLYELADKVWTNGLNVQEFLTCVQRKQTDYSFTENDVASLRERLPNGFGLRSASM